MEERLDLISLLARRWKVLVAFALVGSVGGVLYVLLAPNWYLSTLRVIPSLRSQDAAAASLASKLPLGFDSISTDVQRIQAVFRSDSVSDEVIAKFSLQDRYGCPHIEQARAALWEHCGTAVDKKSNVVSLSCEDQDPTQAKAMAEYFGEVGNRVFRRVSTSSSAEERKFLEGQVAKARADVDDASQKLREFQEKHKIIDLPEQSKAVISAMASIEGDLLAKQLELSYLTSFSSRSESSVMQLQQQIAIMEAKLKQLEASQQMVTTPATGSGTGSAGQGAGSGASFFPNALRVPELRFELEQLMREQKIKETVFFLMTQRYELAKVDEARDTSTFQILDAPTLPTYRWRPQRKKVLMFGGAAGGVVGCVWIVLPVWWRRRKATAA